MSALGPKLLHLHLHDVRPDDMRDHRAVGRGLIDYPRLMAALADGGFGGLMTFELEEPDLVAALGESKAAVEAAIQPRQRSAQTGGP